MRNRVLLVLFFFLIALPESLLATQAVLQSEEVLVQFEKPLENAAKEVAEKATHDGGVTRDIALGAALGNEGYNMGDVASAVVQAECDELQNKPQK